MKKNLLKTVTVFLVLAVMILPASCGENTESSKEKETESAVPSENTETSSETLTEDETEEQEETPESETSVTEKEETTAESDVLKINGGADENGIYSVVVKLNDKAADKGVVELVYHGAKGTPQENSVVNTFRIEYYKEEAGTFEIQTFYDGEVYQNLHHKDEVKVTNTFGAALRAGDVVVSYAPEGEELKETFRAEAEYFSDQK